MLILLCRCKRNLIFKLVGVYISFFILDANAFAQVYIVKKGDTLSKIAVQYLGSPIYGKIGNLRKILAKNSKIKNSDLIYPKQKIIISDEIAEETLVLPTARNPATITQPEVHSGNNGNYSVATEFLSTKINGTDRSNGTKAELVSKSNFGLRLSYLQNWSAQFQSDFFIKLNKLSMKQPNTNGVLQNADPSLYSFGAQVFLQHSPKLQWNLGINMVQRAYLKALSTSEVNLDVLSIPSLFMAGFYEFYTKGPFLLGGSLGINFDAPVNADTYKTNSNFGASTQVYFRRIVDYLIKNEVGLQANYQNQNTSIAEQMQTDYAIYLKLFFGF